jgi:hypothetical protein
MGERLEPCPLGDERFRCADCGFGVKADEDGCCATCGADCEVWVHADTDLFAAIDDVTTLRARVATLEREMAEMREALSSRDLICEALQRELGPERTLRALGLDPERVAQSRREIAEGKVISLDELRASLGGRSGA